MPCAKVGKMTMLRTAQLTRIARMQSEPIYLMECVGRRDQDLAFHISGSTRNTYTVTIQKNSGDIKCSCPDARSHAAHQKVVCKHCCFVLLRILRIIEVRDHTSASGFFDSLQLSPQELAAAARAFAHISRSGVETSPLPTLAQSSSSSPPVPKMATRYSTSLLDVKPVKEGDTCPICFDDLMGTACSACGTCKNSLHTQCLQKWIDMGKHTCVLCRSSIRIVTD